MRAFEFIVEYRNVYTNKDYQQVPYDTDAQRQQAEKHEKRSAFANPHRGPQEGKYLNLMLRGMKPLAVLNNNEDKKAFLPYIKQGKLVLAQEHTRNLEIMRNGEVVKKMPMKEWYVTLPGEEWRAKKIIKKIEQLHNAPDELKNKLHSEIGMLLGIPKDSIRWFTSNQNSFNK
jgi:hypothetical protein